MAGANVLRLGADLTMPLDLVTRRTLVVGQTDTGKTSTAVVMVEEARKQGVQVVVIDPSGAWYGVTSSASGKRAGLDMTVMGGEHGDLPLNEHAGRPVARIVAEHGLSLVLDLDRPHFKSWAARQRFVADFLSELYEVIRGHVLIVIDESHRFAPQAVRDEGGDAARCLGAVMDTVALGRRRGESVVLITQRLAKLHKDVLELCEIVFAHRLRGNNDLDQLRGWVENVGEDWKTIRAEVGRLERGVARVSAPTMGIEGVYRIRAKETFDSSRTVAPGEVAIVPTTSTKADLAALRTLMADTIEQAKADDPKALRDELMEARKRLGERDVELAEAQREASEARHDEEAALADRNMSRSELDDIAEVLGFRPGTLSDSHGEVLAVVRELLARPSVAGLPDAVTAELRVRFHNAEDRVAELVRDSQQATEELKRLGTVLHTRAGVEVVEGEPVGLDVPEPPPPPARPPVPRRRAEMEGLEAPAAPATPPTAAANGDLVAGARRMLDALRRYGPLTRKELSHLANSYGGSMRTNLSTLRTAGLIDEDGGRVSLTSAGMRTAGGTAEPWTAEQVIAMYDSQLVAGARRILSVVMRGGDRGFTRAELEGLANSKGGSFRTNLSKLRTKGLIEERGRRVYPGHVLDAAKVAERRG